MSDLKGILPLLGESNANNFSVTWEPKAGLNGVEKLSNITFHGGELIPNISFHACDESCQHKDLQELLEGSQKPSSSEGPSVSMKIRPDGNWERRRHRGPSPEPNTARRTYQQLLYKSPEVEVFNAGNQIKSEPVGAPSVAASQICDTCSHFGFGMICGGVLVLKEESQSYEDAERWAGEAHDRKDFDEQAFQPSYTALARSAKSCASCCLFYSCLPDPASYILDQNRPITIRAGLIKGKDEERDLSHLKVGLPIIDANYPGEDVSIYGKVEIYTNHGNLMTNPLFGVSGRPVNPADDPEQPLRWLKECFENHESCRDAAREGEGGHVDLPTRLLYIPKAESENPRLVATAGQMGRYLALSYRWGTAQITRTLKDNLGSHLVSIPAATLSKTFQDALIITRRLGFHYIWIDSLCIVQDSPQDWAREAMQMASIYTNATLTISASISDSADSGLFYPHATDYAPKLTLRTIKGKAFDDFFLTSRSVSTFEDDVEKGTLSSRGWCQQERLLSRRILHFGASQTHWECLSGAWSASFCKNIRKNSKGTLNNQFLGVSALPLAKLKDVPTIFTELRQVYAHQPHGTWYHMLRDYTSRSLTNSSDKLPALAGLAAAFAAKTKDVYLNGLWMHGLPEGLLWSSPGLGFGDFDAKSKFSRPAGGHNRAPSWSWASLDGTVEYPIGRLGYIDAEFEGFTVASRDDSGGKVLHYEDHPSRHFSEPEQILIIKAKVRALGKLQYFNPRDREVVERAKESNITCRMPHLRFDDPERDRWDVEGVFALFIGQVGCGSDECEHESDCSYGWGYCLLIEPMPTVSSPGKDVVCCLRVGVAQCYSGDFIESADQRVMLK